MMRARAQIARCILVAWAAGLASCSGGDSVDDFEIFGPIEGTTAPSGTSSGVLISPDGRYVLGVTLPLVVEDDGGGAYLVLYDRQTGQVNTSRCDCEIGLSMEGNRFPYGWLSDTEFVLQGRGKAPVQGRCPSLDLGSYLGGDMGRLTNSLGISRGEFRRLCEEAGVGDLGRGVSLVRDDGDLMLYFAGTTAFRTGTNRDKKLHANTVYQRFPNGDVVPLARYRHLIYGGSADLVSASPGSRYLLYQWCIVVKGNFMQFGCRQPLHIMDLETGRTKKLADSLAISVIEWTPDGEEAYFMRSDGQNVGMYVIRRAAGN